MRRLLREVCSQHIEKKALSWGIIRKSACILTEITIRKSQVLETHGTPGHGKRVPLDRLVWAVGALAEGVGIRAVARVFEVDPNTVLQWLVEAAAHRRTFSPYFLHDIRVTQVQ